MDKVKIAAIIGVSILLFSVASDFLTRSFERYCDMRIFEITSSSKIGDVALTNRSSPLVEIVQTGVKPGAIVEDDL